MKAPALQVEYCGGCVLILLRNVCPHTAAYVSSYCCICVLILLRMCPHTAAYVSSYCCMCPHTATYVSSYCYICVLIPEEDVEAGKEIFPLRFRV